MADPKALDIQIQPGESLRQYLQNLLILTWQEQSDFSWTQSLGSSQWDIYCELVKRGFVPGTFSEDEGLTDIDEAAIVDYVSDLIRNYLFA